jgi:hypothetical protein
MYPVPVNTQQMYPVPVNTQPMYPVPVNTQPMYPVPVNTQQSYPVPVNTQQSYPVPVPTRYYQDAKEPAIVTNRDDYHFNPLNIKYFYRSFFFCLILISYLIADGGIIQ